MYYDGTPVPNWDWGKVQLQRVVTYTEGGGVGLPDQAEEKSPLDGVVQFDIPVGPGAMYVLLTVCKNLFPKHVSEM